ncbi:hypothetical protein A3G67_00855 [Candidatus Roizmanbacteria bacterium RIFCSPLOWO2_12_FULL_40_12]|uniref:Uncharacterized protein n=1 Tax=Candidatus Roizmanbacteria bacterium RIFCSPLOWO2_01_FULL_40_42 TaxID=1802066 RepID=A0A1F7J6Q8_9BACT|nr:MAG: hypothetical protein A2779_02380 [Candidatus Roizmanbacteria bacterium RIFCSPHIGHO2_01_FULL_40_98]OGK27198.1 MAG: hypothetical protein A3C31_03015 [Candidatus Roizmanbacteria bacterium RIFCSPHIGHO2_02_FULL_40_53]OGK30071.1 MAG: hypothetical protein A2W49_04050 [Candidatus Roizmanbacteria bacterium RIFCSPHIGHO2_12_41_18]OGK36071.1 MAG: hypothetical protein A3E69_02960 [Candidatus Roizmanbacteria bacterium RIFCSPHIGHO2_12_FULL_40_130]OGK51310.1 MAG: hypothetical protein A3B50_02595 [Candi
MNKIPIDRFFYYASRFVIIIPIMTVAFILLFAKNPLEKTQNLSVPAPTESPSVKAQAEFDINESYICKTKSKNSSMTAYIKNKSISAITQEKGKIKHTVFVGDCLYKWQDGQTIGEKTCGLAQYVSIAENLSSMNILTPDTIIESIEGKGGDSTSGEAFSFSKSCKKQEVRDDALFAIPKKITFKEIKQEQPQSK